MNKLAAEVKRHVCVYVCSLLACPNDTKSSYKISITLKYKWKRKYKIGHKNL